MCYNHRMSSYLIDSHCHLHDEEWYTPEQAEKCLQEAQTAGVQEIIVIGTDQADSLAAQAFATAHQGVHWTYGIHPENATMGTGVELKKVLRANSTLPVAIGEIGLDYHYSPETRDAQIRLFETMLQLARDNHLPVSLHIREAFPDAFAVLDNFPELTGVVHSFTGSKKCLKEVLRRGFYVGVNGLATYSTLALPPLENMVLETDAPFLTPTPVRGTMNVPGNVRFVARYLAEKLGVAEELIAEETTNNAKRLFHL